MDARYLDDLRQQELTRDREIQRQDEARRREAQERSRRQADIDADREMVQRRAQR